MYGVASRSGCGSRAPSRRIAASRYASAWLRRAKLKYAYGDGDPETIGQRVDHVVEEREARIGEGGGRGPLVRLEAFGLGNDIRTGLGEERVERVEPGAVEHPRRLGDALDLVEEPVAFDAVRGILQRVLREHDHEARRDARSLAAQNAAHALDHLASGPARAHDDAEVRVRHVDAFVEDAWSGDRVELANPEVVEDLAALAAGGRARDQVDRDQRIEPVDRVVGGPDGLGEHQRAVGVADRRRETAEQLVLAARLRHDLAALGERVEVLTRGAAVGPGVALGEVRDRGEEVAEGLERHSVHQTQMMTGVDELLLGRDVLGPLVDRQLHADEGDAGSGAHPVGDGLLEAVPMADAAEERQQQLGDRVVGAFEGRGQTEPLVVLGEQRTPEDAAAETVTLVGDQQPAARAGWHRLVGGRGVTGGDEHVTRLRDVLAAVAQPPDAGVGHRRAQAAVPLLHEDPRRHDDEDEAPAPQRVRGRGDGDVGLAGPRDRFDHAPAATLQPADERVQLPAVELTGLLGRIDERHYGRDGADMEKERYRPPTGPRTTAGLADPGPRERVREIVVRSLTIGP